MKHILLSLLLLSAACSPASRDDDDDRDDRGPNSSEGEGEGEGETSTCVTADPLPDSTFPICKASTQACANAAVGQAAFDACFAADPGCNDCLNDNISTCLANTTCAETFGCLVGCVQSACADFNDACVDAAFAGACRNAQQTYYNCLDNTTEEDPCYDPAFDTCYYRCGNGEIDAGETCDGDCSCAASETACTTVVMGGDPERCSATCETVIDAECQQTPCPSNSTPIQQLGVVAEGDFTDAENILASTNTCAVVGPDVAFAFVAGEAGRYDFTLSTAPVTNVRTSLSVTNGQVCDDMATPLACDTGVGNSTATVTVQLTAAQHIVLVASAESATPFSLTADRCEPSCDGQVCGDDGCGGTCGTCPSGEACNASGQCQCQPQCSGKECGSDGCGGTCGTCGGNELCSNNGQCQCQPQCSGKECGSDGCGGTCGSCGGNEICEANQCEICVPQCNFSECGSDGCGGSCGTCASGDYCSNNFCHYDLGNIVCDPVNNTGCSGDNSCVLTSTETRQCMIAGPQSDGMACSANLTCDAGLGCFGGICRKWCKISNGNNDCDFDEFCNGVVGFSTYGACRH